MHIRLSEALSRHARGWLVVALFTLLSIFNHVIFPRERARLQASSGGTDLIDMQFFYTPATVYAMIASYAPAVRAQYGRFELTADILYPIVYTLFFSLAISWLFQRGVSSDSRWQRLNLVPFGAWLFDLLENVSIVRMISSYPSELTATAWLATVFTMLKWSFVAASIALVVIGAGLALRSELSGARRFEAR